MENKPIDRIMNRYFDGEINLDEANKSIVEYLTVRKFDEQTIRRLDRRRDKGGKKVRTYAEFFRDISIGVRKEHAVFLEWIKYMKSKGFTIKWEKYGTDSVGLAFVEDNDNRPDYLLSINNSPFFVVDVKTCGTQEINTFKKADLKNYIEHNALMLVCIGKIDMHDPQLKSFVFYGQKSIKLLNSFDGMIYNEFAPNKPAIRVSREKELERKKAHISFKKLVEDNLIECIKVTEDMPEFTGPLKALVEHDYQM